MFEGQACKQQRLLKTEKNDEVLILFQQLVEDVSLPS